MNNFLSVVWYKILPPEYGGQKGIAGFNYHLGKKAPLTCLCSHTNLPDEDISYKVLNTLPVSRFQFWNPFVRKKILSLIRRQSFTHIIIEHPWHGWLGKHKHEAGFKFIVHAHNIEFLRMKARGKPWWTLAKGVERKAFEMADTILFKTETDRSTAIRVFNISADKCIIVPYGIKETEQPVINIETKEKLKREYNISPGKKLLLFAGSLNYEPNLDAIEIILQKIVPHLEKKGFQFHLFICGALSEKRKSRLNAFANVTATGFVSSMKDHLQSADVFINPVIIGSGVQTKNIEAIANGCNVVATDFAATGLPEYLVNKKVFVSGNNDWEQFADNIIAASSQPKAVPQQFYEGYNWQNIIDRLLLQL